jgi:hypothetical protein
LLASATAAGETATGWQQVTFSSPVAITAGTTYVAPYSAPNGHYAVDQNIFTSAINSPPLHAPMSASSGGNGVYAYGFTSSFANNSYLASNYWVDVAFHP